MCSEGVATSCITTVHNWTTLKTQAFSGVLGNIMRKPFTVPLDVYWDDLKVTHQFLYNSECSIGLMGRDLLSKLGCSIYGNGQGMHVTNIPPAELMPMLMTEKLDPPRMLYLGDTEEPEEKSHVYWLRLLDCDPDTPRVCRTFQRWKPWIQTLNAYYPPDDPPHVTMNYSKEKDEIYEEAWYEDMTERRPIVHSSPLYVLRGRGNKLHYYSAQLDNIECGQTDCARHIAALSKAIGKTAHIVMRHPLEINTDRGVTAFIGSKLFTLWSKRKSNITKNDHGQTHHLCDRSNQHDGWDGKRRTAHL
ncbi:uncharacterized protein LOC116371919 [Oncorhynchus kisutch]|uniref:uncharacterized protein LOC116371919 n=1 Tax=Oncorhynchus kisutch TaxID=8019 RepID=UPI0012DF5642|nr:uncharacterized protein LOC116371919 [Oncorhynchus kisutch]